MSFNPPALDLVYLWCDDSDPHWLARKQAAWERAGRSAFAEANATARFRDCQELRYSLRGALKCQVFRKIYIVTDGQRPDWLKPHPQVEIVDHQQLIPEGAARPLYNSNAIESYAGRIPALAEHFVLSNDDFFFGDVSMDDFFFADGRMKVRVSRHLVSDTRDTSGYAHACFRAARLLVDSYSPGLPADLSVLPIYALAHVPQVFRRQVVEQAEQRFADAWRRLRECPFRNEESHYPPLIWANVALENKEAKLCFDEDSFYAGSSGDPKELQAIRNRLLPKAPKLFCLNTIATEHLAPWREFLESVLSLLYPQPSPAERV